MHQVSLLRAVRIGGGVIADTLVKCADLAVTVQKQTIRNIDMIPPVSDLRRIPAVTGTVQSDRIHTRCIGKERVRLGKPGTDRFLLQKRRRQGLIQITGLILDITVKLICQIFGALIVRVILHRTGNIAFLDLLEPGAGSLAFGAVLEIRIDLEADIAAVPAPSVLVVVGKPEEFRMIIVNRVDAPPHGIIVRRGGHAFHHSLTGSGLKLVHHGIVQFLLRRRQFAVAGIFRLRGLFRSLRRGYLLRISRFS